MSSLEYRWRWFITNWKNHVWTVKNSATVFSSEYACKNNAMHNINAADYSVLLSKGENALYLKITTPLGENHSASVWRHISKYELERRHECDIHDDDKVCDCISAQEQRERKEYHKLQKKKEIEKKNTPYKWCWFMCDGKTVWSLKTSNNAVYTSEEKCREAAMRYVAEKGYDEPEKGYHHGVFLKLTTVVDNEQSSTAWSISDHYELMRRSECDTHDTYSGGHCATNRVHHC